MPDSTSSPFRSGIARLMLIALGLVLVAGIFYFLQNGSLPKGGSRLALGIAVLLLLLRLAARLTRGTQRRAAEPDPQSKIKLS